MGGIDNFEGYEDFCGVTLKLDYFGHNFYNQLFWEQGS